MTKKNRQKMIAEIISRYDISTQEELSEKLMENGVGTTQATLSRDIREMKLTKTVVGGIRKYVFPVREKVEISDKYRNLLRETVISCRHASNMAVIRTYPGMANTAATAVDGMQRSNVYGTIAGDDTIFVMLSDENAATAFTEVILSFVKGV